LTFSAKIDRFELRRAAVVDCNCAKLRGIGPVMFYSIVKPLIFGIEAESAHGLSLAALRLLSGAPPACDPVLAQEVAGLAFPNPVGLAPGYDKNAEVFGRAFSLGFGFVEVGTVTPKPQPGNPRPRLFRLVEDKAVINRMGFNNDGMDAVARRLSAADRNARVGPLGINIGANKDSTDRIADYVTAMKGLAPHADYVTANISSPNTPGLRALQDKAALDDLLAQLKAAAPRGKPIFLKVAPDLEPADIDDIAEAVLSHRIDALIISNTTITRPPLASRHAAEAGGLSGAPLRDLAQQRLIDFRKATGGAIPLIGVGGIATAEDAYARIRAGASLVQLYSALVYEGPWLAKRIASGLAALLRRDGIASLSDAVGVDVPV
jgi:dihydroorotate dehydrogenase